MCSQALRPEKPRRYLKICSQGRLVNPKGRLRRGKRGDENSSERHAGLLGWGESSERIRKSRARDLDGTDKGIKKETVSVDPERGVPTEGNESSSHYSRPR